MKTRNNLVFALLIAVLAAYAFGIVGCSQSSNPMGDDNTPTEPPKEEIKQPKSLSITKISVSAFGDKSGGNWDFHATDIAKRRADIYVQIRTGSSISTPIFVSTVEEDAFSGVRYEFTKGKNGNGYHLPRSVSAGSKFWINLMDDDGLSADDEVGTLSFRPSDYYGNDNAKSFGKTFFGSNGTKISVSGTWVY